MTEVSAEPKPWHCDVHNQRLLWRRNSVDCPTCGPLAALPTWPGDEDARARSAYLRENQQ